MVAAAHFVRILTGFLVAECNESAFRRRFVYQIRYVVFFFVLFCGFFVDFFCAIKFLILFYFDN